MRDKLTIHDACRRGDIDAVREMIDADPDVVDADDEYEWRPIFHAGLWRHEAIVRLLIEAGADLSAHDGYVLHYAGEVPDNKNIVSLLIQYGALDSHVRPTDDLSRQFHGVGFSRGCCTGAGVAQQASPSGDGDRWARRSSHSSRGTQWRYGNRASVDRAWRRCQCHK